MKLYIALIALVLAGCEAASGSSEDWRYRPSEQYKWSPGERLGQPTLRVPTISDFATAPIDK